MGKIRKIQHKNFSKFRLRNNLANNQKKVICILYEIFLHISFTAQFREILWIFDDFHQIVYFAKFLNEFQDHSTHV